MLSTIHVILSLSNTLLREAIHRELSEYEDIRVVAEVSSPVDLLYSTEVQQADAVILEEDLGKEMPGVLSHLFGEYPQILAVVLGHRGTGAVVYRQRICKQVHEEVSLAQILADLRTADTEYWARSDAW